MKDMILGLLLGCALTLVILLWCVLSMADSLVKEKDYYYDIAVSNYELYLDLLEDSYEYCKSSDK